MSGNAFVTSAFQQHCPCHLKAHTPVHHIAMCCINAHAGVRLTHPVLYSVGVYTDTPTTCMPSDQNNCRLATYTLHVMHHAQFTIRVLTEGLQL